MLAERCFFNIKKGDNTCSLFSTMQFYKNIYLSSTLWSFHPLVESWAKIIALPLQEYSYKLWEHWHFMVFAENFSVSLNILSPIFLKILENIFYHSLQSYVLQKKTNDNLVRLRLYYPTLGVFKQVQNWKRCAVQQCVLIYLA